MPRDTCTTCHAHTDRCGTCGHACDDHLEPDGGVCLFDWCACRSCEPEECGQDIDGALVCRDCAEEAHASA